MSGKRFLLHLIINIFGIAVYCTINFFLHYRNVSRSTRLLAWPASTAKPHMQSNPSASSPPQTWTLFSPVLTIPAGSPASIAQLMRTFSTGHEQGMPSTPYPGFMFLVAQRGVENQRDRNTKPRRFCSSSASLVTYCICVVLPRRALHQLN